MKNKAFTLIELLAVIIILGILMLIAIPSVTNYINNSRKSTYVTTVNELVKGTIAKVNSGDLNMFDTNTTYYVPCTCIKLENGEAKSPYGKFDPAYVVVTFDGTNYHYYFTGKDVQNMGVPTLTSSDVLSKESIVANVEAIDTTVGIEGTSNVYVFSDECNGEGEIGPAVTTVPGGADDTISSNKVCIRANELHTATCEKINNYEYCYASGYDINGSKGTTTITYGFIWDGTSKLKSGDAFDCDVNDDGIYDPNTERFYYVSECYNSNKNSFDNNCLALVYYNNINQNIPSTTFEIAYDETGEHGRLGPVNLIESLPTSEQWKHKNLILQKERRIVNELGTTTMTANWYNQTIDTGIFNYSSRPARLLTLQEVVKGCGNDIDSIGYLDKCVYLLENTKFEKLRERLDNWWLETVSSSSNLFGIRLIDSKQRNVGGYTSGSWAGLRPVIEVLKKNIE